MSFAALLLAAPVAALALPEPSCEPPESDRRARQLAGEHFQAGMDAVATQNLSAALYEFVCSFQVRAHPYTAYNIARTADQAGRHDLAVEYYRIYLHLAGDTDEREEVQTRLAELEGQQASHPGTARIEVDVSGARVSIDGSEVGRTPLDRPLELAPGRHHVLVTAPGYRDHEEYVNVVARREARTAITLVRLGEWQEASAGSRWGPILIGVAAVAAAGGIYFGLQASDRASEFRSMREDGASLFDLRQQRDSAESAALVADVAYLVAVVSAGAGVAWWSSAPGESR
jgi:hypothetical protein